MTENDEQPIPLHDRDTSPHDSSPITHHPRTALVTGGAGLIGSHIADGALAAGWDVRILDNLQRQTHREGKPAWVPGEAEFIQGDVRSRRTWERALDGIDVVFHQAAYGGYMPEIAKF